MKVEWSHRDDLERPVVFIDSEIPHERMCMQFDDGWYLHDQSGFDESGLVAGPFSTLDACKAAYILMWGTT